MPGRILILEDREKWRKVLTDELRAHGYHVDAAANPAAAAEFLERGFYHLLVLDISMDGTSDNAEGLEFLGRLHAAGQTQALSVILLSGFLDLKRAHAAVINYGAIDFFEKKDFDNRQFIRHVTGLFANKIKVNLGLDIVWQRVRSAQEACWHVRVGGTRLKPEDPHQQEIIARAGAELDDLLRRLFYTAETILVQPIQRGRSGTGILRVQPFYAGGPGRSAVVKFGEVESIRREEDRFQRYVKNFLGGGRSTSLEDLRQTSLLAGIRYSMLGEVDEEFEDFASYYDRHELPAVLHVLDNLFRNTCSQWYAGATNLQLRDLGEEYAGLLQLTPEKLEDPIKRGLKGVKGKDKLYFDALGGGRAFNNPLGAIGSQRYLSSVYSATTHGDLNSNNILVDGSGSTWLIDFVQTGPGHVLRDFAMLDTSIRLLLLPAEEATLAERLLLEEALLAPHRWSEISAETARITTASPAMAKCFATICHLRQLAAEQISRNAKSELKEYWIALLYLSLNMVRFWDLPTVQREHALLSAALLAENL